MKHFYFVPLIILASFGVAHAFEVQTSTKRVYNAQQYKAESTKHYDKLYYLSEIKLKQKKTNREKAIIACSEIPNAIADVIRFNNMNKSLFDERTRTEIEKHNKELTANNQTMYTRLKCDEAKNHYKIK